FNWLSRKRKDLIATKYDAAQTSHENRRHWAMSDGYSADTSLTPDMRRTLRNRSRYETSNNSYAKGIVLTLAGDTIGTGPRPQVQTGNDRINREIEKSFYTWAQEVALPEKLRTMQMTKTIDGEAFALLVDNPRLRHAIKLDLTLLEAERQSAHREIQYCFKYIPW
ncbi:MAG: phage portal protein, partial [Planctomycetia bacterium]|nr:phage portal protein [Planctomycetia bacterium]